MNKILLSLFLVIALMGTAWANNGWYSTLQGTASDVQQSPPPNGVTIAYNTTDHEWEFNYGLAPAGGTTGTCLEKNSNSDYDYSWVTCSGGGGTGGYVSVPANSSSTCTTGQYSSDSSYYYICEATNTWLRTSISTWSSGGGNEYLLLNQGGHLLLNIGGSLLIN